MTTSRLALLAEQNAEHGRADVDVILRHVNIELVQEVVQDRYLDVVQDLVVVENVDVLDRQVVQVVAEDGDLVVVEHADVLDVDVDRQNRDRPHAADSLDAVLVRAGEATATGVLGECRRLIVSSLIDASNSGHGNGGRKHHRANQHSK